MPPAWIAAPLVLLVLALGDLVNRKLWGFLPDDPPGEGRKQHGRPMPLAGVLLLPVLVVPLALAGLWYVAAAVAVAMAVGFVDDRGKERGRDLHWRRKTLWLGLAAGTIAVARTPAALAGGGWLLAWAALAFVLINATNFLDNMNGVCAALSATSLLLLTGGEGPLAWAGWAALGALPWNWPWPRAFLGDAGAYGLGACVAAALLPRLEAGAVALLPVCVQLADFVQVVLARVWLGLPPWVGDRRHLTHILAVNCGVPGWLVAPVLAGVAVVAWWLGR